MLAQKAKKAKAGALSTKK
jgi:hypothetical protein